MADLQCCIAVFVLMGDATKKQSQFRSIGFSIDECIVQTKKIRKKQKFKVCQFSLRFMFVGEVNI